jgi:hypothetical protein
MAGSSLACEPEAVERRKYSPKSVICSESNAWGPSGIRKRLSIRMRHRFGTMSHVLAKHPATCGGHTCRLQRFCDTLLVREIQIMERTTNTWKAARRRPGFLQAKWWPSFDTYPPGGALPAVLTAAWNSASVQPDGCALAPPFSAVCSEPSEVIVRRGGG